MHIEQAGEISIRSCKTVCVLCAIAESSAKDVQKEGPGLNGTFGPVVQRDDGGELPDTQLGELDEG